MQLACIVISIKISVSPVKPNFPSGMLVYVKVHLEIYKKLFLRMGKLFLLRSFLLANFCISVSFLELTQVNKFIMPLIVIKIKG